MHKSKARSQANNEAIRRKLVGSLRRKEKKKLFP
jgi:hypothetical protein